MLAGGAFMGHAAFHAVGEGLKGPLNAIKIVSNIAAPLEYPSAAQIIDVAAKQFIGLPDLEQGLLRVGVKMNVTAPTGTGVGIAEKLWTSLWVDSWKRPEGAALNEVANRFFWGDGELKAKLVNLGYYDDTVRAQVANLRYDIPGPADLVRFSVRHVWEPDLLARLGYDEEFPGGVIDVWHAMKGLDYKLFSGPFAEQIAAFAGAPKVGGSWQEYYGLYGIEEPTWARAYWWSHWVLPSPGQFFQMLIRLDPDRDRSFDSPEMLGLKFDLEDYELGLRANDYPPQYRRMLAAINRPIIGVRFLRGLVDEKVYDYDDVVEWARRWGYPERDRKNIADLIFLQSKGKGQAKAVCKGCATCDQAFEVGILSENELAGCYTGYGASEQDAQRMAALAVQKLQVKRAKELVANVRKRFLKGSITQQDVQNLLFQFGIKGDRIEQYLRDWGLEFEAGRRELSAAAAIKAACNGFIGIDDLRFRLQNLNYPQADIDAMTREALLCAGKILEQSQAKQARLTRQQAADAYTNARRLRQSLVEAQRYLASHGAPRQLHDWFCSGTIGEPEVFSRLNALGWPDVDIGRFLSDCKSGRKPTGAYGGSPAVAPLVAPVLPEATEIEGLP